MTTLEAYKLKKEEAEQRLEFKKACDSCVPNKYIELDNFILGVLEELTNHCIETQDELEEALEELAEYQSREIKEDFLEIIRLCPRDIKENEVEDFITVLKEWVERVSVVEG